MNTVAINDFVTTKIDFNPSILSNVTSVSISSTHPIDSTADIESDVVTNDLSVTNISKNNEISEHSNTLVSCSNISSVTDVNVDSHFQHAYDHCSEDHILFYHVMIHMKVFYVICIL